MFAFRQRLIGLDQQLAKFALRGLAVTYLGDQFAHQRFGNLAAQAADRLPGRLVQFFGFGLGQIGNIFQ